MTVQRVLARSMTARPFCVEDGRWPALLPTLESANWPAPPVSGTSRLVRYPLNSDLSSPRSAREFARTTLAEWGLPEVYCDAGVVVSELVTNAVRYGLPGRHQHSRAPIQMVLMHQERRVLVIVTDPSPEAPHQTCPDDFSENGRGLQVVAAVSEAWGWAPLATGGKAVWASFAV